MAKLENKGSYEEVLKWLDEHLIGNLEVKATISKALEKQIPKKWKPATTEIGMTSGKKLKLSDHICPICGYSLAIDAPYCECCGQAIDWSD